MKFKPKCLLSDCDGVIVDSEIIAETVVIDVLGKIFGEGSVAHEIADNFGIRVTEILAQLELSHAQPLHPKERALVLRDIDRRTAREAPPIPGVRQAYESLGLPVAVVSNSSPERIRTSVERAGLSHLVGQHMYSGDDVQRPKPAPDVYLLAAAKLGVDPSDCLVIEDSLAGVKAASAASMQVIGFLGGSHIKEGHEQRLRNVGALAFIHRFQDLASLLA